MAGIAVVVGSVAFLGALLLLLFGLTNLSADHDQRLFQLNATVGSAIVLAGLGGFLAYQGASALGGQSSKPFVVRRAWLILPAFPVAVLLGQLLAQNSESCSWLFPIVNVAMVSIPSLFIAALAANRYQRNHPLAWPVSWREWTSGFIYGAVGATMVAGVINTAYLLVASAVLVQTKGDGDVFPLEDALRTLPRGWGIFLDLSTISLVAPLNEEFWKGMLVAFFFFRKGGAARCFLWGILAGTGFNLFETFGNSLALVNPDQLADNTIGRNWWIFASARAGTAAMHGLATGLAALGFYGLLRQRPAYLIGYPAGVLLHGTWNFLVYAIVGDAFFSGAGPDTLTLDVLGIAGLALVFAGSLVMMWLLSGALRDEAPAPIYQLIGMRPRAELPPESRFRWPQYGRWG